MAQDIVPIELGLTQGDLVTLWAPRWREEGEEWEAFLGHEEDLYAFPDVAHLAAFARTATEHDLTDHPAWHVVPGLTVAELSPDEDHQFDLVGVPELAAEDPDTWVVGELAEVVSIVRSLAEVCDLEAVLEILDSSDGFGLLSKGTLPFTGREGEQLWADLGKVVAERWDEVLDAIDSVVSVPEVDEAALTTAQSELAELTELDTTKEPEGDDEVETVTDEADEDADSAEAEVEEDEPIGFWAEVGIDPIKISTGTGDYYTLRCYLDEEPVFLGSKGKIDVFGSPRALARYLVSEEIEGNDLTEVSTWQEVEIKATDGDLYVEVDPDNVYTLTGIADDIDLGPDAVDPTQLELAVELFEDAAEWAGDDSVKTALNPAESLGWLVSFVLRPDPTRLAPSPPYGAEVAAWRTLDEAFEARLNNH
ncbi:primosomal protein [Solihabitans fulvus]|uniref:Primosomal protein n=1 Tax=Solihabitans fulvus TaxID=1892852 RepID=A0A5B2WH45_9PSEU|nr:primosomal protein [Solihabitans fulvus]KAA2251161.1 primosomal protein [Solihabitans fulvus]